MKSRNLVVFFSMLVVVALALAACGTAATPAPTQAPAATAAMPAATAAMPAATAAMPAATTASSGFDWSKAKSVADGGGMDALVKAAQAEGELTVITLPHDWCDYGKMMDDFNTKYGITIVDVNPEGGSKDEITAIQNNEGNKGPQAPDVIDVGPAYGPSSKASNLLAPYKVTTWDTIKGNNDPDGYFYVDYYGVMSFEVNSTVVKDVPKSWQDLLKPEYKGQIGLAGDPRSSNEAAQNVYAAAMANGGTLDNLQPGLDFMKKLASSGNLLPLVADPGPIAKGETPVSIHWNYLALSDKADFAGNPEITVVYPTGGPAWGGYYYQAISAYAPHPAAARLWEEYLYSDEGQNTLVDGFCTPARMADMASRNVIPAASLAALPAPSLLASAVIPNIDQLNAAKAFIAKNWDSAVGLDVKSGQ
jgi:putative spermidine/putrescine transport system substrate-binding protein